MLRSHMLYIAVSVSVALVQTAEAAGRGAQLAREMRDTGKPALIIAGNEGCIYCRQMAEELATDRSIQSLARQFLILKVNTESADWPQLRATFSFEESGIPAVFVVRADGELLYSASGKPSDLSAFLERQLESAGTILEGEKLRAMQQGLRQADRHLKRRNYAALLPIIQEHAGTGSYARAALAVDAVQEALLAQVTDEVAEAEERVSVREPELQSALTLAELRRALADFEPAAEIVNTVWTRLSEDEPTAALLEQATILDSAALLVDERKWSEAAELYESVVNADEGSPAVAYAREQLTEVRARGSVTASDEKPQPAESNSAGGEPPAGDERAAASYLKFAERYLERDPEKARDYLQRAIDAAPDSDVAEDARRLLEQLGEPD